MTKPNDLALDTVERLLGDLIENLSEAMEHGEVCDLEGGYQLAIAEAAYQTLRKYRVEADNATDD